jgi:hypothetical protein
MPKVFDYTTSTKTIVDKVATDIEMFVAAKLLRFEGHRRIPLSLIIALAIFIPIVAYVTLQATTSMFRYRVTTLAKFSPIGWLSVVECSFFID